VKFITKILGQFQQQVAAGDSAPLAKERLKVALTYDRNGLEQGTVEQLRGELVRLMAEHLDVSAEDVHVDIDETTGPNRLVASIALRPPRRRRAVAAGSERG
jgi:cell division topological specificity factor MinE